MINNNYARVKVAYKKLKQMVYFEKHPLSLRRRLAEFECGGDFEDRLELVTKVVDSPVPHETMEFKAWVDEIGFDVIPKSLRDLNKPVDNEDDSENSQGSYVTNVTSSDEHLVEKVNYMFDGPVELHLLSVLWLMMEGREYDHILSEHCLGSRLHQFVGDEDEHSAYLFKKYHELYAKWRDTGIQKARHLLTVDHQSVCLIGLDVQEYYYRIQLDWDSLRTKIKRHQPKSPLEDFFHERQLLGEKLFTCIEMICKGYRDKLSPMLAITHPDLPDSGSCLPIGFSASPVLANCYLKEFDDAILNEVRPAYYGRYVDDILMVVTMPKPPEAPDPILSFMDRVLVSTGILEWDGSAKRYELCAKRGLFLQSKKCVLQYFDAEHSTAGLDKFQKQIEENASDFALLPVDGDDSPVAQVAYDLLYDGSANKFRSVKAIAENRWELAGHIAKQTQLHLMTEGPIDYLLRDELFRFFKGRNAIEYWDMWERVLSFLVVAGDSKGAKLFRESTFNEIRRVRYVSADESLAESNRKKVSASICRSLKKHLDYCMELSFAISDSTGATSGYETGLWRDSNLIRHHLVATPLLNYTDYEGNFASPWHAGDMNIDHQKVLNTPRFVHFDECLGFVDSVSARCGEKDSVTIANEIYSQFHGSQFDGVTSKLVDEDPSK